MDETNTVKCRILVTMCGRLFFVFDHKREMLRQKKKRRDVKERRARTI